MSHKSEVKKGELVALFHLQLKQISKKNKSGGSKSIAAVVAYRERIVLNGFDYSKKDDFVESYALAPERFLESDLVRSMATPDGLVEIIESVEKRKDAQLFDELIVSLQHELSFEENKALLNKLLTEFYVDANDQFCKVCIHNNNGSNLHAHVLIPQRPLQKAPNGRVELGKKIRQDFAKGKPKNAEKLILMRSRWSEICNAVFEEKKLDARITHESLKTQKEKALQRGDVEKAMELDRPSLNVPLAWLNPNTEIIVKSENSFEFDFVANKTLLAYHLKRKDLDNLTLEDLKHEKSFKNNLKAKRKGGLKLIRKLQKVSLKKIIQENLRQAESYFAESVRLRIAAVARLGESLSSNIKSKSNQFKDNYLTRTRKQPDFKFEQELEKRKYNYKPKRKFSF